MAIRHAGIISTLQYTTLTSVSRRLQYLLSMYGINRINVVCPEPETNVPFISTEKSQHYFQTATEHSQKNWISDGGSFRQKTESVFDAFSMH